MSKDPLSEMMRDAERRRLVPHEDLLPTHRIVEDGGLPIPLAGLLATAVAFDGDHETATVLVHATPAQLARRARAVGREITPSEIRERFRQNPGRGPEYSRTYGYVQVPAAGLVPLPVV